MKITFLFALLLGLGEMLGTGSYAATVTNDELSKVQMMKKKAAMAAAADSPQQSPLDHLMCEKDGIAAGGMDLVSYRQSGGPVFGIAEYSIEIMGDTYIFADETNLETFRGDPQHFLPAYAGFCAMSLALGRVTCPDVMNYKIEDDVLLFFEVTGFTNGQTLWESDPLGFRTKADLNYERLDTH